MSRPLKTPADSAVEMRELVMPNHTNPQNTIFGGQIMSWIDIAAAMTATKHAERNVVTVHVDSITFEAPVKIGYHVLIQASVNYVGNSSIEIGLKVWSENPISGDRKVTTRAYLTFVTIDDFGKPCSVKYGLNPVTDNDKRRYDNAIKRVEARKKLRASLK